jgi:hypothetical protein
MLDFRAFDWEKIGEETSVFSLLFRKKPDLKTNSNPAFLEFLF